MESNLNKELMDACEILEISERASINEIKDSFRRLSIEYHPDTTSDIVQTEKFLELKKAYDLLMEYCFSYEISFYEEKNKSTKDKKRDHVMRFYDGWLGDIKEEKDK